MIKRIIKRKPVRSFTKRGGKKEWPYYYPDGKRVPFNIRMQYFKELKAQERSRIQGAKSRSSKQPKRAMRTTSNKGNNMARRKTRVRYVTRKVKRSRRSGAGAFNVQKLLIPIGVATVVEPIIDSYANQLPIPNLAGIQADDIAKVAIGLYLGKKGGLMGNTAKMLGIFGVKNIIGGFTGNLMGGTQTASVPTW